RRRRARRERRGPRHRPRDAARRPHRRAARHRPRRPHGLPDARPRRRRERADAARHDDGRARVHPPRRAPGGRDHAPPPARRPARDRAARRRAHGGPHGHPAPVVGRDRRRRRRGLAPRVGRAARPARRTHARRLGDPRLTPHPRTCHHPGPDSHRRTLMAELLYRLGRACARRARTVLAAWLAVLVLAGAAFVAFGGTLASSFSIPGTPTADVTERLQTALPEASGGTGTIVLTTEDGAPFTPEQEAQVAD